MGCWASRPTETALMALCRSRKALIREAIDHRYALAAAHAAYFRSLAAVGDGLLRYAREGLSAAPEPAVPVVTLPTSRKNNDGDGSGGSSATPLSHSPSDEGSHLHISSESETDTEAGEGKGGDQSGGPNPNYYYMRSSSATPNVVYGDPYGGLYDGYVNDPNYYYSQSVSPPQPAMLSTPPPPPPPGSSAWDFLDPFSSYEQFLPRYFPSEYGTASVGSSSNSSEVRAREGIPDLEEETEPEGLNRVKKGKIIAEDFEAKGSGIGSSKTVQVKEIEELDEKERKAGSGKKVGKVSPTENGSNGSSSTSLVSSGEKASKLGPTKQGSNETSSTSYVGSSGDQESSSKKKGVTFDEGTSLVSEKNGTSDGGLLSMEGKRDVVEALGDIKEEFKSAISGSEEVSKLLEVGKMPYRPRNRVFKVISSRILVCVGFRISSRHFFKHRRRLAATTMNSRSMNVEFEKHVSKKSVYLSTILEKLHLWEKKLYDEVKAEERLRVIYEKKLRKLKSLDDRGAELHKINATQISVRSVRTKISIAITSVDVISKRMNRIMDEELQPQLVKLIQRLTQMWKLMLGCYQKQLRAIVTSKNYNIRIRTVQDSVTNPTIDLELILLKWLATFNEWITSQKSFVNSLNGWLSKWLSKNREETDDGIAPFSPTTIGAPSLFILTNDWSQVINRLSEADVKSAIQSFAANMHKLRETQDLEQKLNQKADSLSKEYSAKLNILQMENGDRDLSTIANIENTEDDERFTALDSMKKRLDEVKAKHVETLKQVQEVSSASLTKGLIPIFQSLSSFTSEILRAHEAIRIPNNAGGRISSSEG
ncbi:nitrate regulatory gene2 protein [Dendrobium catenatum]|uniref:nitrate regulatory gene2 protein n=1 Tax=Dendrobium catenatum TaxID=906689 RepID=UPI0009F44A1B|nr:nitrate regulatory gene2 protein [Dendrobium catenatum]